MSVEKLKAISGEVAAAKKRVEDFAKNEGRAAIGAAFAKCFEPPTKLTSIRWSQYTPYFNDGEECVFTVNTPYLEYDDDGQKDEVSTYPLQSRYGSAEENLKRVRVEMVGPLGAKTTDAFLETWALLDQELLRAVFGDHVEIVITKDDVTVEEYDHE